MKNVKSTKRALLSSVLALVLCMTMLIGTTFAWFTDRVTTTGNKIQSGTLKIDLELYDEETKTWNSIKESKEPIFNYEKWEPGYTSVKLLKIENEGNLALKWYAKFVSASAPSILADVIDVYVCTSATQMPDSRSLDNYAYAGTAAEFINNIEKSTYGNLEAGAFAYLGIALKMQESAGNEYQNLTLGSFDISILATQDTVESDSFGKDYDAPATFPEVADKWDGTSNIDWFINDPDADSYTLNSAEELAGFAALVNGTAAVPAGIDNSLVVDVATKNFELSGDVDLSGQQFMPIGGFDKGTSGVAFEGVFDGNGHTIYGLTQSGWDLGYSYGQQAGMGLFGLVYNATVKNLTIDSAEISMEAVVMGTVAGYAAGDCTFEDITITNTQIANYNWDVGGIVGQLYNTSEGSYFKNINIDETTTISGHWGTWDVSAGGVIGRTANNTKVFLENVNVACVLDVYNDACAAYQWFAYRYSGMVVGYTKTTETVNGATYATAPHVVCNNVTVTYGDWANYTYCQPSNVAPQYVREQGGYSTDPYYSGRHWTAGVDANGNKMVDANHAHNAGEAHNELLAFDQLFGGGQGVYGKATHDGVTVIYNNK